MTGSDLPFSLSPGPSCNDPEVQSESGDVVVLLLLRLLQLLPEPVKKNTNQTLIQLFSD